MHDCRHHFASWLIMCGASLRTVQILLGHKDIRMTQRYAHLSSQYLKEVVDVLDKKFEYGTKCGTIQNNENFENRVTACV